MKKEIICTICPQGCHIAAEGDETRLWSAEGYTCKRGLEYAAAEFLHPVRILTSTMRIENGDSEHPLVAVRSNCPIPKQLLFDCMAVIRNTTVQAPVQAHQVLIGNICDSGGDIIASTEVL